MNRLIKYSVLGITTLAASTAMAGVTFFEAENFAGRQFTTERTADNFVTVGFNDRAKSAIVEGGSWEVCVDVSFNGGCTILKPGRYPTLGVLGAQISSARPMVNARAEERSDRRDERRADRRAERERDRASATMFSGPKFTGRSVTLGGAGESNLNGKFNDQASSLRVTSGYWIFCSEAEFRGECRTFGPGDYAALPKGLDNRISSGRYISNDYPYTNKPNWKQ
jgi:hypothetical protein